MGIPPATLASMARLMPAAMARSQSSAPARAISSLLAVTTDFFWAMAASMISRATPVPPIKFGDDVDVGMIHHFAPIRGAVRGRKGGRDVPLDHAAAAHRHDAEREAELLRDQLGVFREDVQGPEADVAETDDADVDWFH